MKPIGIERGKIRCRKCGKIINHLTESCGCIPIHKIKWRNPKRYARTNIKGKENILTNKLTSESKKLTSESKRHLQRIKQKKKPTLQLL